MHSRGDICSTGISRQLILILPYVNLESHHSKRSFFEGFQTTRRALHRYHFYVTKVEREVQKRISAPVPFHSVTLSQCMKSPAYLEAYSIRRSVGVSWCTLIVLCRHHLNTEYAALLYSCLISARTKLILQ